jgi:hypothetical protein
MQGNRQTGFSVFPDAEWPKMWRIRFPNGSASDMVNLSRAKDAATVQAARAATLQSRAKQAPTEGAGAFYPVLSTQHSPANLKRVRPSPRPSAGASGADPRNVIANVSSLEASNKET